jgi:hypothetical protein
MAQVDTTLAANRDAISELIAAVERTAPVWTVPRAPGKWAPNQIVEHVARTYEESANMMSGASSKFPNVPSFLRPVVRSLVFRRVLKNGAFPKARTNKAMNPVSGPATPAEGRVRLEAAFAKFDRECRECANAGRPVPSATFGQVTVADYAQFIALHTQHHCKQMPA